jgi:hypothetical protein
VLKSTFEELFFKLHSKEDLASGAEGAERGIVTTNKHEHLMGEPQERVIG